jgi:hypothetical protein
MKKNIIQTLLLLSPIVLLGQENGKALEIKRNSIYLEVYGQGLYNSISVDRLINIDKTVRRSVSAGITLIPHPALFVLGIPMSYNLLFGKKIIT